MSNAWVTCPIQGDNNQKWLLIPHKRTGPHGDIEEFFTAYPVKAIDTTAAGDCFTAAFALALSQNKNWKEAIEFGQKASSIAVTRKGAQTSIPTREEVDEMKGGKM